MPITDLDSRPRWARPVAAFATVFGAATLYEGGAVLLGDAAALAAAGSYVPFVVWFNFLAGFAYVAAGWGLWLWRRWAIVLSVGIAGLTLLVFAAFAIHVALGGAYEPRTVVAMILRTTIWGAIAVFGSRADSRSRSHA